MTVNRIIEITTNNKHLSLDRGFMVVTENRREIAKFPLDDIAAVIGCAHGLTYSNNLLTQLATRKAILIICGSNFLPVAFLWAVDGHHQQSARIVSQLKSTMPKSKQVWKQIVRAKISHQAKVLARIDCKQTTVDALVKRVRSGDITNIEATAARRYWPLLFGNTFRRDQNADGVNSMLNYGYTIIRSAMARSVMAAGLHPSIGVHHSNQYNAMCLVDDLMEPFRPYVDLAVYQLLQEGKNSVTPDVKAILVSLLEMPILTHSGITPLRAAIQTAAISLARVFEGQRNEIDLPIFE